MEELETMSVKDLQAKLVSLGMPEDDVAAFKTKAPLIASIKTLMAKDVVVETYKMDVKENGDGTKEYSEVKKVATIEEKPNPTEEKEVNRRWKDKAEGMKAHLMAQEKVSILIPLDPTEKVGVVEWRTDKRGQEYQVHVSGAVESVQLNGYKYFIPKGIYTKVPRQVAEVISKAQQQTLEAGSDINLNRTDPLTGRPFSEVL